MEGFGAKDQDIAGAQHHISPRDQDLILPLDGGDNDPVREMELMGWCGLSIRPARRAEDG